MPELTLRPVTPESRDEVVAFVEAARRDLFPMLAKAPLPPDLAQFDDVYLQGAGAFLEARAGADLVGVIGYLPYDNRFAQFDYGDQRVRVACLSPAWRGGTLVRGLESTGGNR